MNDDLRAWAASRDQPAPTRAEAVALTERWRRTRQRRTVAWATAGLALAAAVVLLVLGLRPSADVVHETAPQPVVQAEPRELFPGVHHEDGDVIEIADDSSVIVTAPGALVLTAGQVAIDARPRPSEDPLTVTAGGAIVTVIGTRFSVALAPLRVEVSEGVVRVAHQGETYRVAAGESYPPRPVAPALPDIATLRTLAVKGDPTTARAKLRERLAVFPDDADAWALLARLETRADRRSAARRAWEAVVSHGRPRLRRQARYELARLLEDRPRQAIPWLEAYLADPGPLVPEALLRLGRAQRGLGDPSADDTLRRVVTEHPGTAAAASARALLGDAR